MNILLLGGTSFVGRHIAAAALAAGHGVTLFHRGQTNPALFPEAEHLTGDRDGHLDALRHRRWDAVVDTSGYLPRIVAQSAHLLRDAVPFYVFISSVSVYADSQTPDQNEDAPLATLPEGASEEITGETYGAYKVLCEQVVAEAYGGRTLVIRPGLVAGPHDPTDRFTYWPFRSSQGGAMIVNGNLDGRIQYIDARDLAEWTVRMTEARHAGTFNAVTADPHLSLRGLIDAGVRYGRADTQQVGVDDTFLLAQGLAPRPRALWLPTVTDAKMRGFCALSTARAVSSGLTIRSLQTTVADTLDWANREGLAIPLRAGLAPEREQELLAAWKDAGKSEPLTAGGTP